MLVSIDYGQKLGGAGWGCWYHRVLGLIAIKGWVNSFRIFRDVLLARKVEELQVL
jgi:hypothetical protein